MALDRDELPARAVAARAALLSLCEALSALVPVAPASGAPWVGEPGKRMFADAAPATEPRRTVGAVTHPKHDSAPWIVINGDETDCCRRLDGPNSGRLGDFFRDDVFVRWATREECERHGLNYVARPLPGAPLAAPSRPEWVRITGPEGADYVTVGKAYRVKEWDKSSPLIENDRGEDWWCAATGDEIESSWPSWEPCAAPGETAGTAAAMPGVSPGATPAAWVPSVGDVVQDKDHPEFAQLLVTRVDAPAFHAKVITRTGAPTDKVMRYADRYRFVRRATSSERAAAGLPVEESEVDRVALAKVIREDVHGNDPVWDDLPAVVRDRWLLTADRVLAFLKAKRGAS